MSLDLRVFQMALEKLTDIRPIPYTQHLENYIKAYYLEASEMLAWIKQNHSVYKPRQLVNLVQSRAVDYSKQARGDLIRAVYDIATKRKEQQFQLQQQYLRGDCWTDFSHINNDQKILTK